MLGLASGGGPDANLRAPSPGLLRQRSSVPRELSGHENHSKSEPHSLETRLRGPLRAPSGPKDGAAGHARGAAARAAEAHLPAGHAGVALGSRGGEARAKTSYLKGLQ